MELLAVGDVALEGLLGRDRDPLDLGLEPARVDPAGAVAEQRPDLPRQQAPQRRRRRAAASAPIVVTPAPREALLRPGPDAREQADVEGREKRRLAAGPDDGQPARLAPVGGDLRDHLAGGDAERARQRGRAAHGRLHRLGHAAGGEEVGRDLAQVEVALVEAGPLDGRHDLPHRPPDRLASTGGRARGGDGRRPPAGSGAAPRRSSSRSGCRTCGRRSSRSRPRRGRAGRRRRPGASGAATGPRAPRRRRRRHRGRGGRRSRQPSLELAGTDTDRAERGRSP